ncbi:DUF4349 domain-containing protein [Pedobacter sp. AW31-3R]|uniref:DUF4349 domain-containing protein n=1 Tax=Pedobacter sp. AW31-3R TaxID=3445781 RepID=UPI003FA12AEF
MKNSFIYCLITIALFGCNSEKSNEYADQLAKEPLLDTLTEKIIKTADMRFRVRDVQSTKERLSSIIGTEGGAVTEFSIHNRILQTEKVRYSADSLLELNSYQTDGVVIANIPVDRIDAFMNKVARMAVFVEDQSMKMDNQGAAYLSNFLKKENNSEATGQLKKYASKKNNQVKSTLDLKNENVDKKIANMLIDERVKMSTITLNFYQSGTVKQVVVANEDLSDYRPHFFTRLMTNFLNGWVLFVEFILFVANLWVLLLFIVCGYLGFRYYSGKKNKLLVKTD